jgi:cytidylate kinase
MSFVVAAITFVGNMGSRKTATVPCFAEVLGYEEIYGGGIRDMAHEHGLSMGEVSEIVFNKKVFLS